MATHIGADIAGTLTDLAPYDAGTVTTHARPLNGIMACIDKVGTDGSKLALVRHDKAWGEV